MKHRYEVGRTIKKSTEFPEGVPCIIYDGDSVLCEFHSVMYGLQQAIAVCETLNAALKNAQGLQRYC